ncbi:DUF262 domain-containing protein, partial [bacterium]
LDDIFDKRIFRIPDYQRGYAWGEKQLVDFWEDLMNLDENRLHYTGVLSIKKVPDETHRSIKRIQLDMEDEGIKKSLEEVYLYLLDEAIKNHKIEKPAK